MGNKKYRLPSHIAIQDIKQTQVLFRSRLIILFIFISLLSCGIVIRVTYLDILKFQKYHALAKKNQVAIKATAPIRGLIFDRDGRTLARNIPVYNLELIPEQISSLEKTLQALKILVPSLSEKHISHFKKTLRWYHSFESVPLMLKLAPEEVAQLSVNQYHLPGVKIKPALMRDYPLGSNFAHIIGYVGQLNQEELKVNAHPNYRVNNFIGKNGIESTYESMLRGNVGYQEVETDASGKTYQVFKEMPALAGHHLYLTIDAKLQKTVQKALKNYKGAAIVLDPTNGEILALASAPSFNPNDFVQGLSIEQYQSLLKDPKVPLYNRAIRGQYPLASTIKPFLSIYALSKHIVSTNYRMYDYGWYKLPNNDHKYRDWKRSGHGWIDIINAIVVSCDTFFYQLAHTMGIEQINQALNQFGFGQLTDLDLNGEVEGIVPNPTWKKNNKRTSWYTGDTIISGIGQGSMLTTPLQLANATASIANRGYRFRPHLLKSYLDPNTHTQTQINYSQTKQQLNLRQKSYQPIIYAMEQVIKSPHGTGRRFGRNAPYTTAAKTGTAQVYSLKPQDKRLANDKLPENLRDHSLFIGFAPIKTPEIVVSVVLENDNAAPAVAREIMDFYFKHKGKTSS